MGTSPRDLLDHAKEIREARSDETAWRCAASRAYYAAMHTARRAVPQVEDPARGTREGTHERVFRQLSTFSAQRPEHQDVVYGITHQLKSMKNERTRCDYFLDINFTSDDCDRMMRRAEGVIELCARLATPATTAPAPPAEAKTIEPRAVPTPTPRPSPPPGSAPGLRRIR